ncbi:MAG: amidohydrolase family protein [Burkholderiales bacterium]|nr:amidohydrolase family protein [Burkholderiales bacterium]
MSMDPRRFALVAAEWFDGEQRHADGPTTFTVVDGRLDSISRGDRAAELANQGWPVQRTPFLMPGLVDAHVHLFLDGAPTDMALRSAHLKQAVPDLTEAARRSARQALACGVTGVRDAGDRHGINNRVREEARGPASGMARVRSGGSGIKRAKRYGAFMATDVEDEASIRNSVRELALSNDEIKLILTGIIDFDAGAVTDEPQFDLAAASVVVEAAHAADRKVFAHCSGAEGLAIAAAAGVDSIEHGFFMSREILAQMRDRQLAWTPTFCPVHFQWAEPQAVGWKAETVGKLRRILDSHAKHLRLAHEMGVPLLLGTDAGSMGVPHGRAVFDEIERFIEAGLPLQAALTAATAAPRRHFGASHPTLVAGAPFDAVSLPASPFDEHSALRRPQRVWSRGVVSA